MLLDQKAEHILIFLYSYNSCAYTISIYSLFIYVIFEFKDM